ncbi:MAG: FtsW/RodA/SpoVE family cell cycle protein [Bacteroidales bacterium]|nr:FtsW/RodA/SpoVE family cell cycle protein [Bacteroidales bacterium]MBR3914552.1 FtsW/RodA/SpoVE family cell cycle protein [Bacteroidales bacterium]
MRLFNKLFQGDRVIWMVALMLAFISLLAVYSATGTYANSKYDGNNAFVLLSHAVRLSLGLVVLYAIHLVKYTYYSRIFQLAFWVSIPLLAYTMFFGADLNDAQRVVNLFGVSFQSSDLAKIALIGYLARELTIRQDDIKDFKNAFVPLMLPVLVVTGLIFPENFSTAAILFASCMVLLFVGRINFKYLMIFFMIALFAMSMYILIVLNDKDGDNGRVGTWERRIESFFRSDEDLTDEERAELENKEDFQEIQAKIAIAGGGLWGKMPGNSTQRNFLPHPYSDFIFAIIVEEYGLIGGAFVVLLYLILFFRAIKITTEIPQSFGGFLAFGLSFMLVMQAMINMGVAVGILPVTGQPLPLVSMGGTSLMFTGCAFGMILSVSKEVKNKSKRNEPETTEDNN